MLLETGFRGGALALLSLLAIIGLPGTLRSPIGRATLLFDLCVIAFLIETAPGILNRRRFRCVGRDSLR
jgi:hypothetical protein